MVKHINIKAQQSANLWIILVTRIWIILTTRVWIILTAILWISIIRIRSTSLWVTCLRSTNQIMTIKYIQFLKYIVIKINIVYKMLLFNLYS